MYDYTFPENTNKSNRYKKVISGVIKWFTKTKLRKILSSTLAILILITSIRFLFLKPKDVYADSLLGFNEGYGTTVNDNVGNISGTITNAVWKSEEFCKIGKCLYFDGTGDLVNFGDDGDLDFVAATNFTLTGWFRTPDITSGTRVIIAKHNATAGGYKVYIDSSGYVTFGVDDDSTFTPDDSASSSATSTAYDDNKWHHFAAVKTGTTSIALYIDGILHQTDSSIAATGTLVNADTFYIGIDGNGSSNGFSGFLDEIKVYSSTARSAAEIKADLTGETRSRGVAVSFGPDNSYLTNGLVGYWKMDEADWTNNCSTDSALDSSGNGNNGDSCPSTTGPDPGNGKFGNGGIFDGSDDIVTIPDSTSLNVTGGNITVSGWFYFDSVSGRNSHLMVKYNNLGGYVLDLSSAGTIVFYIYNGTTSVQAVSSAISANQWVHIAGVYDSGNTGKVYINGELSGSVTASGSISSSSGGNLILGDIGWAGSNDFNFDGKMDDVRIYNRSLSQSEIFDLYSWAPGPMIHLKMDENTGSTTYDSGGNSIPIVFTNAPVWTPVGKFGSALTFDGDNDYIESNGDSNLLDLRKSGFSAFTWIKETTTASNADTIFIKGASSCTTMGYNLLANNSTGFLNLTISDGSTCIVDELTGTTNVGDNNWHYVGFTWDPTVGAKIYADGTLQNSASATSSVDINSSDNFTIGGFGTSTWSLNGSMDDIKTYNYARTPAQIIADMNGGHPAPGSPVGSAVAKWKFDEGNGTTAYDSNASTGGAEDLTLSTASWTTNGKFGKAWNGTGALWLSRANDADLDFSASESFTLSGWFKSDSATNPTNGTEYILSTSTGNTDVGYQVYAKTDGTVCFAIDDDGTWTDIESCTSTDYYDNTWHHFTAVRNVVSDTTKIYIDAVEKDSDTDPTTGTLDGNNVFYIGDFDGDNNATSGIEEFAGDIDEVQVFRSALTNDEIKLLYNQNSMAVMGAKSTNSSGVADWSAQREYCPPGNTENNCGSGDPSPIAEWKMDENTGTTLIDSSGNGNTSTTWTGNTKYNPGKFSSGLLFDGVNDVVRIAESATTDLGGASDSYSISAWFKTSNTANTDQVIVAKNANNSGAFPFYLLINNSPKAVQFQINDGTTNCEALNGNIAPNDGKWHLATGVWDTTANIVYVYQDGVLMDTTSCSAANPFTNDDDISIGNGQNSVSDGDYFDDDFDGSIDNVRIYNYARTPAQVAWEYNHGLPTAGWWKLDDNVSGNGATIYDSSSWEKNGTTENGGSNLDCTITGKNNLGCDFDGSNDSITMGSQTIHNLIIEDGRDFSISGWFNRDTFTTDDTVVAKRVSPIDGSQGWIIWIDDSTDKLTFEGCDANVTCDEYMIESTSTFTTTGWNHFVFIWDDDNASNTKFYINGIPETVTQSCSTACAFSDMGTFQNVRNFRIGAGHAGTSDTFDGKVDNIMLYGHALNSTDIKTIYNQGSAVRFAPLTGSP